jgi:hypothetical protein
MDVCFECDDVEWTRSRRAPSSLAGALRGFVVGVGLHPKRDWPALARAVRRAVP